MDVAVSTTDLCAEGSLMENTSVEMSPVARQANTYGGLRQPHSNRHLVNGHLTLSSH